MLSWAPPPQNLFGGAFGLISQTKTYEQLQLAAAVGCLLGILFGGAFGIRTETYEQCQLVACVRCLLGNAVALCCGLPINLWCAGLPNEFFIIRGGLIAGKMLSWPPPTKFVWRRIWHHFVNENI